MELIKNLPKRIYIEKIPYQYEYTQEVNLAADPVIKYMTRNDLERAITQRRTEMIEAAKNMEFIEAARLRDEILKMEEELKNKDE